MEAECRHYVLPMPSTAPVDLLPQVAPELLARKEQLPARTFLARMLNNLKQVGCLAGSTIMAPAG